MCLDIVGRVRLGAATKSSTAKQSRHDARGIPVIPGCQIAPLNELINTVGDPLLPSLCAVYAASQSTELAAMRISFRLLFRRQHTARPACSPSDAR
jgi:hypothetical protein